MAQSSGNPHFERSDFETLLRYQQHQHFLQQQQQQQRQQHQAALVVHPLTATAAPDARVQQPALRTDPIRDIVLAIPKTFQDLYTGLSTRFSRLEQLVADVARREPVPILQPNQPVPEPNVSYPPFPVLLGSINAKLEKIGRDLADVQTADTLRGGQGDTLIAMGARLSRIETVLDRVHGTATNDLGSLRQKVTSMESRLNEFIEKGNERRKS